MNSQKRLLLTLKYLWEKTDEEHPSTLKEIGKYLQHNGIETTRKTLQADINLLTGFGIDIICNHSTQNQYHIGERVFEVPEVKLLVDAVQSARFITAKKSKTESAITLLCENELMTYVIDRFGESVPVTLADENHFSATVKVSLSQTFYGWVFSFGGKMKIQAPQEAVDGFQNLLHKFQ